MKKRHLIVGFSIVLAISLTVPALGAGGLGGIKSMAKKAMHAATGAQGTADNAQQAAGNAQDAAKTAQNAAGAAQNKAASAEGAASAAQGMANSAKGGAEAAQGAANAAQGTANAANSKADAATAAVAAKFGHIQQTEPGASINKGNNVKEAIVACPAGTQVISGGFHFTSGTAEVHADESTTNGWRVQAQSGGDPYDFVVVANCLAP